MRVAGRLVFSGGLDPKFAARSVVVRGFPLSWYTDDVRAFIAEVIAHTDTPFRASAKFQRALPGESATEGNETDDDVQDVHIPVHAKTGVTLSAAYVRLRTELLASQVLSFEAPADAPQEVSDISIEKFQPTSSWDSEKSPLRIDKQAVAEGASPLVFSKRKRRAVLPHPGAEDEDKRRAMSSMTLDRYLLAPDLLFDIEAMHQRRFVRQHELVHPAFLDQGTSKAPVSSETGRGSNVRDFYNPFGKYR